MKNTLLAIIFLSLLSCDEIKEVSLISAGYDYFPVLPGQYRVYEVEEIIYNVVTNDTSTYLLREYISDSIPSLDQTTYLLTREKQDVQSAEWKVDSVWSFSLTENYLRVTENNTPFMKLTFPVRLTNEWDGNALNTRSPLTYYYQPVEEAVVDSIAIEDHIRLIIEDREETIVGVDLRSEIYVRNIGLVEKNYLTLNYCTEENCGGAGNGIILSGRLLNQKLIDIQN